MSLRALRCDDFAAFHAEVHGVPPFIWQERLLRLVVAQGWPQVLNLPTGVGKTSCIDIALFALAMDARSPVRVQPVRIALVVDRRVVVDQAADRGRKLQRALDAGRPGSICGRVATELLSLCLQDSSDEAAVGVFTLRGGIPKDDGWVKDPSKPLILASTIDQIGSRMLIQGYGVGSGMRPVHAGMLANDILILLDEVHLSQPFADTLQMITNARSGEKLHRLKYVMMSATPGIQTSNDCFSLDDQADYGERQQLWVRLSKPKYARLVEVADRTALEERAVKEALGIFCEEGVATHPIAVGVVVNRVESALRIATALRNTAKHFDVRLVTGRMRPVDRDDLMQELRPRVETGWRTSGIEQRPIVVVGTQCIEAGADFDFDCIITECASFDALRQRFGRVNRVGGTDGRTSVVLVPADALKPDGDPIYGKALAATNAYLKKQVIKKMGVIDFSVDALKTPEPDVLEKMLVKKPRAPQLLPAYLDLWMQTSPKPSVVPEPSLWLHGPDSGAADVQLIWRCDIPDKLSKESRQSCAAAIAAVPPTSLEAMPIPFVVAKRWLHGETSFRIADVEGAADEDDRTDKRSAMVFRWRGDRSDVIDVGDLRPGDTIVLPVSHGGMTDGTFDPRSQAHVADVAERACFLARGIPTLRVRDGVLRGLDLPQQLLVEDAAVRDDLFRKCASTVDGGWKCAWLGALLKARAFFVDLGEDSYIVLRGAKRSAAILRRELDAFEEGTDATTDDEASSFTGKRVALADHSGNVERNARRFAKAAGLSDVLVEDLAFAGYLHDVGKADRRFQILLHGGDEVDFLRDETPLAKSGMPSTSKVAHQLAVKRSGYPKGTRHEVMSVAMIEANRFAVDAARSANDWELVLHLVASHHGYCRPFPPIVEDNDPVAVELAHVGTGGIFSKVVFVGTTSDHQLARLSSPIADRFWNNVEKHGWWRLCFLEAILRLADHRASEAEQTKGSL